MSYEFALTKPADFDAPTVRADLWGFGFRRGYGVVGERYTRERPKNNNPPKGEWLTDDHPILDRPYAPAYGCFDDVPAVVFRDVDSIYFYNLNDGGAWMEKVHTNLSYYLNGFVPWTGDWDGMGGFAFCELTTDDPNTPNLSLIHI